MPEAASAVEQIAKHNAGADRPRLDQPNVIRSDPFFIGSLSQHPEDTRVRSTRFCDAVDMAITYARACEA